MELKFCKRVISLKLLAHLKERSRQAHMLCREGRSLGDLVKCPGKKRIVSPNWDYHTNDYIKLKICKNYVSTKY